MSAQAVHLDNESNARDEAPPLIETTLKYAFSILALALVFPAIGEAQSETLTTGTRIRVTSPSDDLKGHVTTVTDVHGDSIVVAGRAGSRTIALTDVTALDISTGTRTRAMRYGLIGFGAGAATGAVLGYTAQDDCSDAFGFCGPVSAGQVAAASAAVFGVIGLLTGAVAGSFQRTDRWESRTAGARVSVIPVFRGGVALSVSRSF